MGRVIVMDRKKDIVSSVGGNNKKKKTNKIDALMNFNEKLIRVWLFAEECKTRERER